MAAEYGLRPTYKKEFHEVFTDNQEHPEFKPLLERMKVVDKDGESQMDEDQWEAASESLSPLFYLSFLPDPGLVLVLGDGEGGVRHGVFVLGYHSSAFFAVYPHQSSSPALPSRDPVVAPRSWSSFVSMLLPPSPTMHGACYRAQAWVVLYVRVSFFYS